MPIDDGLLAILVCPACRGRVAQDGTERGIECRECHRVYPIRDGIPVMLIDEAPVPRVEDIPPFS